MRRSLVVAGAALVLGAAHAQAQGSAVMTHSSCATAMGAAGVADPCDDGSAILFNPAAIANQRSVVGLGWTGVTSGGGFTYDVSGERIERESATTSVPFLFASHRFTDRFAAGIGVFNPYGLTLDWGDPEDFEGRYVSYETQLRNIYVQPTVAFRAAPWLSFGAGVDVVAASIDINQRADLGTTPLPTALAPFAGATFGNVGVPLGTDFADVGLSGTGTGVGFHLGAQARFTDRLSMGVRYMSEVEIDYEGDAEFTQIPTNYALPTGLALDPVLAQQFAAGGPLGSQALATNLTLPQQLVVGVAVRPIPALRILADYQWTGWSSFDEAPIDFQGGGTDQTLVLDYQDADTYRLGAELMATPALALRGGFIYNTAAEREFSVSPLLPEAERNYYSAGLGYRLGNGLGIDAGYQFIDQSDRRGRVRGRAPGLTQQQLQALNVGVYDADASVLNVTLSYRFGGQR